MHPRLLLSFLVSFAVIQSAWGRISLGKKKINFKKMSYRSKLANRDSENATIDLESTLPFNPELPMSTVQIISYRGYPASSHTVTTEDGYILEIHRIPYGKDKPYGTVPGRPVILAHAFAGSSAAFVIAPTNRSLAFQLADFGYDVWLCNFRGNIYSRNHAQFDINSESYWDFSWDEMARYDVPAIINFILKTTGQPKLSYIAASMGNTVFFPAMIYHPELNDKIDAMMALGPVTSLRSTMNIQFTLGGPILRGPLAAVLQKVFRDQPFMEPDWPIFRLQSVICNLNFATGWLCSNGYFIFFGFNPENWDPLLLPALNSHFPQGTSFRSLYLYIQNYLASRISPTFIPYDFGEEENLRRYNQTFPPPYDLSKVTAPVYLIYSENDWLADPVDVKWLAEQLPNLKESILVEDPNYNHMDFLWAKNVFEIVFKRIYALLPPPK